MPPQPTFTLGIEEEFQIVDPETRELRSHIAGDVRRRGEAPQGRDQARDARGGHRDRYADLHRTSPSSAARGDAAARARSSASAARAACASPPPARIRSRTGRDVSRSRPNARYDQIVVRPADGGAREPDLRPARARRHRGPRDAHPGHERGPLLPAARLRAVGQLAVLVRAEHRAGRATAPRSSSASRAPASPTTFRSASEFDEYVQLLIRTNCIDNAKKIWWDVRPHPFFPTLEYRICDVPMRVDETICIAALFQAITVKLWKLYRQQHGLAPLPPHAPQREQVRARRGFGIQGKLIDFGKQEEVPYADLLEELLAFVDDVVDDLGSREAVYYARTIVARGTGADRQLQTVRRDERPPFGGRLHHRRDGARRHLTRPMPRRDIHDDLRFLRIRPRDGFRAAARPRPHRRRHPRHEPLLAERRP